MIFATVCEQSRHLPISQLCNLFNVSRASYYRWSTGKISDRQYEDEVLKQQIKEVYVENRGYYGAPRIHQALRNQGVRTSRKRVARLMREEHLVGAVKRKTKRGGQKPEIESFTDQVRRKFDVDAPNQVWVSDITYIKTLDGWLYAAPVIDLFSRRVVGLGLGVKQDKYLAHKALAQAIEERRPPQGLISHSDHGGVYRSNIVKELYDKHGILGSMGSIAAPGDNAVAESFMSTLKAEVIADIGLIARDKTAQQVFLYIMGFYNNTRLHSTLGYLSPAEFERRYFEKQSGKEVAA